MELSNTEFIKLVSIINRARIECRRKRYDSALLFLEQAVETYAPPLEGWVGAEHLCILMGDVLVELQNYEEARAWYFRSKECIDKIQLVETDFKIGKTYYEEGNMEMAKKAFSSILSRNGKKPFLKEKAVYYHLVTN